MPHKIVLFIFIIISLQSCNRVYYSSVYRDYPELNVFKNLDLNWTLSKKEIITKLPNNTNAKLYNVDSSYSDFQYIKFIEGNYLNIPVSNWYFTYYYDHMWRVSILFNVEDKVDETQKILDDYFIGFYGNYLNITKGENKNESYINYELSAQKEKDYICDISIITHLDSTKNLYLELRFQNNHYGIL